jgi:DNA-binding NarL/FixJ family response regulator
VPRRRLTTEPSTEEPSAPEPPTDAASTEEPIRLVIVESRALLGVGIREVLDREPDIDVVAQVHSPDEAMPVIDAAAPDVVLVDVPPEAAGADAVRRMHQGAPGSALVVVGGEDDDASILDAMEVGATAHVAELAEPEELIATIRRVADGEDPLKDELAARPDLVERIVDGVRDTILADRQPTNPLTARELEILSLVGEGLRNRAIAERLGVSEQTVKNHLSSVMHKFGVPNRTQAVAYALRHGWLVLRDGAEGRAIEVGYP